MGSKSIEMLHERVAELERERDRFQRQVGGSQAANNRLKQKVKSLEKTQDELFEIVSDLCDMLESVLQGDWIDEDRFDIIKEQVEELEVG